MAFPTFDVSYTTLEYLFAGLSFSDWSTRVDRWIQQAAGDLASELEMIGYPIASASALGAGSQLYTACQVFIESSVAATLARTSTHEDPARAKQLDGERERLRNKIRVQAEGLLGDDFDNTEQIGGFRPIATGSRGGATSRWRKGRCF